MMKTWERHPNESASEYAAFQIYLALPSNQRSVDRAYAEYQAQKRHQKKKRRAPGNWFEMARKHHWSDRACDYDIANQRRALALMAAKHQKEFHAYALNDMRLAQALQRLASKRVADLMKLDSFAINPTELRSLALAYDVSRNWFKELMGLFDSEYDRLLSGIPPDDVLAMMAEEANDEEESV